MPNILAVTPTGGGPPVKVAQLSYTFGFNGLKRPAGEPWLANETDPAAILRAAHAARAAGAQIVVLSIHWGVEYSHTPNAGQTALAKRLLDSPDIDLILGCHEHVVQPIATINGKFVVYGMGNQLARHAQPIDANREGIMPEFTFTEGAGGQLARDRRARDPDMGRADAEHPRRSTCRERSPIRPRHRPTAASTAPRSGRSTATFSYRECVSIVDQVTTWLVRQARPTHIATTRHVCEPPSQAQMALVARLTSRLQSATGTLSPAVTIVFPSALTASHWMPSFAVTPCTPTG